jgi:hypothetical protein
MSKRDEKASSAERDEQNTDSVFDFLYHDIRRVGSFLAQFDNFGHLQSVTASEGVSKGGTRGYSLKLAGAVPVPGAIEGAEGSLTFAREPGQNGSESFERTYDPLWTNARTFLDYISEQSLLNRDLKNARIGQFVLATGKANILDLEMIKRMWDLPPIQALVKAGAETQTGLNRQDRRRQGRQNTQEPSPADMMMAMVKVMPHTLQISLRRDDGLSIWGCLASDSLVGKCSDLVLKYGLDLAGAWTVVGILDALPDPTNETDSSESLDIATAVAAGSSSAIGTLARIVQPVTRTILGRPTGAFGITPLLVFREVTI